MRSNKDDDDDDDSTTSVGPDILPSGSHDVGGELMEEEEEGEECSYEPESEEVVEGTLNVNRRWSQSEFSPAVENVRRRGRAADKSNLLQLHREEVIATVVLLKRGAQVHDRAVNVRQEE